MRLPPAAAKASSTVNDVSLSDVQPNGSRGNARHPAPQAARPVFGGLGYAFLLSLKAWRKLMRGPVFRMELA